MQNIVDDATESLTDQIDVKTLIDDPVALDNYLRVKSAKSRRLLFERQYEFYGEIAKMKLAYEKRQARKWRNIEYSVYALIIMQVAVSAFAG